MAFITPLCMKLTIAQYSFVDIGYTAFFPNWTKSVDNTATLLLRYTVKYVFLCTDFHNTYFLNSIMGRSMIIWDFTQIGQVIWKVLLNSFTPLNKYGYHWVDFHETYYFDNFVKSSYTGIYQYPTHGLTYTGSRITVWQMSSPYKVSF
jgi:hypothetical protein